MNNRILTLKIEIHDKEAADWIWKAYPKPIHGITVHALSDGDQLAERDMYKEAAVFFIREEDETTEEAIDSHFNDGFDTPECAEREAKIIYPEGTKYEIINRHGDVVKSNHSTT